MNNDLRLDRQTSGSPLEPMEEEKCETTESEVINLDQVAQKTKYINISPPVTINQPSLFEQRTAASQISTQASSKTLNELVEKEMKEEDVNDEKNYPFFSQLNALFVKHNLEWVRTPFQSFYELLWPVLLFGIAAILRKAIVIEKSDWTLDSFKQTVYPVGKVNNLTREWQQYNFVEKQKFEEDLQEFQVYNNFTNTRKVDENRQPYDVYIPDYDFVGPYFFYPMACYSKTDVEKSKPIIGYIKNDNDVERALIAQYQMVFQSQQDAQKMITQVPAFMNRISEALGLDSSEEGAELTFEQIIGNQGPQLPDELIIFAGGIAEDDAGMAGVEQFGNFTFVEFDSKENLEAYLSADDYPSPNKPGMCFGFQITENDKKNKYELEVFANDKWPQERRLQPDATYDNIHNYANGPFIEGYVRYVFNGYHMIENWVANIILQLKTETPDAKIVSLISPQLNRVFEADAYTVFLDSTFHYFILMMYLPLVYRYTFRIVQERQTKNKMLMKSMGMRVLPYWLSWWASYTIMNCAIALICSIIAHQSIFLYTQLEVLCVSLFLFGQAIFPIIWVSTTLFDTPEMACVLVTVQIWSMTVLEFFLDQRLMWTPPDFAKIIISIVNPMFTIKQTFRNIVQFDNASMIVSFQNGWILRENYSLNLGLILLMVNIVVGNTVAFIMETRLSNIEDKDKKCCLCFKKSSSKIQYIKNIDEARLETENCNSYIFVQELSKSFGSKNILDDLNLTIEDNKIISIVGVNGSGKTTFLQELSKQICTELKTNVEDAGSSEDWYGESSKQKMGILPQDIVLFNLLTPFEHLEFYRSLKGFYSFDRLGSKKRFKKLLVALGFDVGDKYCPALINKVAGDLAEANRRKLQIAIALCSEPKILLLDDPFSGLDHDEIISLAKYLQDYKQKGEQMGQTRLICLTTSSIEVSQLLSERIIEIKDGKLTDLDLENQQHVLKQRMEEKEIHHLENQSKTRQEESNLDFENDNSRTMMGNSTLFNASPNDKFCNSPEINTETDERNSETGKKSLNNLINNSSKSPFEIVQNLQIEDSAEIAYPASRTKLFSKQVQAVFKRRWRSAFNEKKNTLFRMIAPICVIILGYFSCRTFVTRRTESRQINPDWFQNIQQITVNELPVDFKRSDTEVQSVLNNLPMYNTNFDVNFANQTTSSDFYSFRQQVYDMSMKADNSVFGSYLLHQINVKDHQYKFTTFTNTTEARANLVFPQFMFEAILKTSVDDPEFEFKTSLTPFPLLDFQKDVIHRSETFFETMDYWTFRSYLMNLARMAEGPIFVFCASYTIGATYVLYTITQERLSKQKSLQMISGLQLASYWVGNYLFDVFILQFLVAATIICFVCFDPIWTAALPVFVIWPFSVVAVQYAFSLFFKNAASTFAFTITTQMFVMLCLSQLVFNLRILSLTEFVADVTMWVFRSFANFPIVNSLYCNAVSVKLTQLREFTKENDNGTAKFGDADPWSVWNCFGDLSMQFLQLFACVFLIILVELEQIKRLKGAWRTRFNPIIIPEPPELKSANNGIFVTGLTYKSIGYDLKMRNYLTDVSFSVNRGQLLTLISEQNEHKTALIQTIIHELIPSEGFVYIGGEDMSRICSQYPHGLIGYAPKKLNLFEWLTVEEHLEYYASVKGVFDKIEVESLIESLNLEDVRHTVGSKISQGNSRLLQIAIALIGKPKVLIIDGAFDGLDSDSVKLVCSLLELACKKWRSAVLVGVPLMPDDLKRISTNIATINRKRGKEFFELINPSEEKVNGT